MIDSHSHIFAEDFDLDRDEVIARAKASGVNNIILVGFSKKTNQIVYEMTKNNSYFIPTYGVHPSEVDENYLDTINEFKAWLKDKKCYAIGECGLDYHWDITYKEEQKAAFRKQIELSLELDLPLVIHSRDANQDTLNIIKEYPGCYGVMHCYSGSLEMALEYLKQGFYISLGGPVTFKNAKEPKKVALGIPLDRLLLETDSPYLAPMPFRGKRNESAYVKYVRDEVALLRGMSPLEIDRITEENARRLFKIGSSKEEE